jgi:hypothetical protein
LGKQRGVERPADIMGGGEHELPSDRQRRRGLLSRDDLPAHNLASAHAVRGSELPSIVAVLVE